MTDVIKDCRKCIMYGVCNNFGDVELQWLNDKRVPTYNGIIFDCEHYEEDVENE